ncbi:hypothetical protein KFL_004920040 [Klebsormidium nitens]|uniref:Uncharacterized protein n=1 Tax=Klebsormidium nitens TaxID=105231 RepID=A0A1Y1IDX1_KLENI|nr:hypothetical protein KFL_004920040 [Klebsormidium nitens]|eukprot:GAQ89154.1 hypothetical protein KFL_004920040 [Klebsormidium nitens]
MSSIEDITYLRQRQERGLREKLAGLDARFTRRMPQDRGRGRLTASAECTQPSTARWFFPGLEGCFRFESRPHPSSARQLPAVVQV